MYDGKLAYVPALEDVLVWDVKKGQMVRESTPLVLTKAYAAPAGHVARNWTQGRSHLHRALTAEGHLRCWLC